MQWEFMMVMKRIYFIKIVSTHQELYSHQIKYNLVITCSLSKGILILSIRHSETVQSSIKPIFKMIYDLQQVTGILSKCHSQILFKINRLFQKIY